MLRLGVEASLTAAMYATFSSVYHSPSGLGSEHLRYI